ncbi:hypothetical protein NL449_29395, partial [Klebsiella pneumoniae]|nr:hypothetical protein [Klebsiella pneumoniae]
IGDPEAGGVARFATLVRQLKAGATRYGSGRAGALIISSGDNFLAGPEFNASLTRDRVPFYDSIAHNRIGYDAMVIGNH